MELLPGPALDVALREGPLAAKEVVRLGAQLARGLAAAHEQGIVHRDLKPSNLALTTDGLLKVLDFGLAQLQAEPVHGGRTQDTPTDRGVVLGSPPQVSPEQLLGRSVDARSDIYSAGACLFELATGKRPFGDRSGPSLVEAILHETPEPASRSRAGVSPGLEAVVAKAMDKEPGLRYQTARELLVDLERLQQEKGGTPAALAAPARLGSRERTRLVALAGMAVGLLPVAAWLFWPRPSPRITAARPLTRGVRGAGASGSLSWATDGQRLYYLAAKDDVMALFQAPISGGEPVEIPLPFRVEREVFAYVPSASALLMRGASEVIDEDFTSVDAGAPLWLVPVPSGTPRRLGNLRAVHADASPDGRQLILTRGPRLLLASIDGQTERALVSFAPNRAFAPRWAPDGRRIRYSGFDEAGTALWETSTAGEVPRRLWPGADGQWTASGRHFVFERRGDIFVVREARWPGRSGEPERLTFGPIRYSRIGASPDGRRLFALGTTPKGELVKLDPATRRFLPALGGESAFNAEPSPAVIGRTLSTYRIVKKLGEDSLPSESTLGPFAREEGPGGEDRQPVELRAEEIREVGSVEGEEYLRPGEGAEEHGPVLRGREHGRSVERQDVVPDRECRPETAPGRGGVDGEQGQVVQDLFEDVRGDDELPALSRCKAEDLPRGSPRRPARRQENARIEEERHSFGLSASSSASSSAIHASICWRDRLRGAGGRAPSPRRRAARKRMSRSFSSRESAAAALSIWASVVTGTIVGRGSGRRKGVPP
jgi:hypothetical protein